MIWREQKCCFCCCQSDFSIAPLSLHLNHFNNWTVCSDLLKLLFVSVSASALLRRLCSSQQLQLCFIAGPAFFLAPALPAAPFSFSSIRFPQVKILRSDWQIATEIHLFSLHITSHIRIQAVNELHHFRLTMGFSP